MKAFRKTISILLAMIILLSIMPVISFSAANDLELNTAFYLNLETDEYVEYTFTPTSSGYYRIISSGDFDTFVVCYDSSANEIGYSDDLADTYVTEDYDFNCVTYLTKGETYTYVIGCYSEVYDTLVYFEKLDVDNATTITEGNSYPVEFEDEYSSPALFKFVPETDGYYGFYSEDGWDPIGYLYDSNMNLYSAKDDTDSTDFFLTDYLFAGDTYYFEASRYYLSDSDEYCVGIRKAEVVTDIEIASYPDDMTVVDGYIEDTIDLSGLVLNLTYSDGSVLEWSWDDDKIPEYSNLNVDWYYDEEGYPFVEFTTPHAINYFYLEVVENNVESISVESCSDVIIYQGYDGYYDEELGYDYYEYSLPYDLQLRINYTDGTHEIKNFYDDSMFYYYDDQWYYPWELGENYVYIGYFDAETYIPVQVVENPVEKVTLNSAPTAKYAFGDPYYGVMFEDGEYLVAPYNLNGISVTVEYKDGTVETYDNSDIDYDTLTVDGLPFMVDVVFADAPGVYTTTLDIIGNYFEYDIEIIPEIMLGDVDYDEVISIIDATSLQRYAAKLETLTDEQIYIGDVDKDSIISVIDATRIQMYVAKLITDEDFFYLPTF